MKIALLLPGGLALAAGVAAGLARLGWPLPALQDHGPLMVGGFLGTVIGLERAAALGGRWPVAGPLLTGAAALLLLAGQGDPGRLLMLLGSLSMVAVNVRILRLRPAVSSAVMLAGAVAWVGGNLVWNRSVPAAVPWWIAFLVLTVAGERLDLSRLRRLPRWAHPALVSALVLAGLGLLAGLVHPRCGWRLEGLGLLATGLWFLHFDLARRTLRQGGLTGFSASGVLLGHLWLAVGGALMAWKGPLTSGPAYDAVIHCFFLGFAFSMIFAHAPIIAPALLGVTIPFRPCFYGPLTLLQLSLLLRIAGDLAGWGPGRAWGGLLNGASVALFVTAIIAHRRVAR